MISGIKVSWKIWDFHFDQFLIHQKKFQAILNLLFLDISRCSFKIHTTLCSYKVFLTSYVGLKVEKN